MSQPATLDSATLTLYRLHTDTACLKAFTNPQRAYTHAITALSSAQLLGRGDLIHAANDLIAALSLGGF